MEKNRPRRRATEGYACRVYSSRCRAGPRSSVVLSGSVDELQQIGRRWFFPFGAAASLRPARRRAAAPGSGTDWPKAARRRSRVREEDRRRASAFSLARAGALNASGRRLAIRVGALLHEVMTLSLERCPAPETAVAQCSGWRIDWRSNEPRGCYCGKTWANSERRCRMVDSIGRSGGPRATSDRRGGGSSTSRTTSSRSSGTAWASARAIAAGLFRSTSGSSKCWR